MAKHRSAKHNMFEHISTCSRLRAAQHIPHIFTTSIRHLYDQVQYMRCCYMSGSWQVMAHCVCVISAAVVLAAKYRFLECMLQADDQDSIVEEVVFEHERVIFLKGWSPKHLLPTERRRFSRTADGAASDMDFPEIQCPSGGLFMHQIAPAVPLCNIRIPCRLILMT